MQSKSKSDVEKFYDALCAKLGITTAWKDVHPQKQHMIIEGINLILTGISEG